MKKQPLFVLVIVGALLLIFVYVGYASIQSLFRKTPVVAVPPVTKVEQQTQIQYKNSSYRIEGSDVQLSNGYAETEATPGSLSKITTRYFGNEAIGDLNGDGVADVAFLLTQETGGSGTFFYLVAALKTQAGYQGSEAYFLGDRIAPQTTEYKDGVITVNYADRKEGVSFAEQPTEGKSIRLSLSTSTMKFVEVK